MGFWHTSTVILDFSIEMTLSPVYGEGFQGDTFGRALEGQFSSVKKDFICLFLSLIKEKLKETNGEN